MRVSEADGVSGLGVLLKGAIRVPKNGIYRGFGLRVSGLGFGLSSLGFRVSGLGVYKGSFKGSLKGCPHRDL